MSEVRVLPGPLFCFKAATMTERRFDNPGINISDKRILEGEVITGRPLADYQAQLDFKHKLLEGKKVLNFGAGNSLLEDDLRRKGVASTVVDVDISIDAASAYKIISPDERTISAFADRKFAQADGRKLPFKDRSFDYVLALWSTYQIPPDAKKQVYGELMRVGDTLHVAPVFKRDYDVFRNMTFSSGFEIVSCQPYVHYLGVEDHKKEARFTHESDYEEYMRKYRRSRRVKAPMGEDVEIYSYAYGGRVAKSTGASTIVLRRNMKKDTF